MTSYRVTHDENRCSVGEWTKDLRKGQVLPASEVPDHVADHLIGHGVLIECKDNEQDNLWYDSDDPDLASRSLPAKDLSKDKK